MKNSFSFRILGCFDRLKGSFDKTQGSFEKECLPYILFGILSLARTHKSDRDVNVRTHTHTHKYTRTHTCVCVCARAHSLMRTRTLALTRTHNRTRYSSVFLSSLVMLPTMRWDTWSDVLASRSGCRYPSSTVEAAAAVCKWIFL